MPEQLSPQTPEQALQRKAANLALTGNFKEAVRVMLESLGMDTSVIPPWALPGPMTANSCGQMKAIGHLFLYRRPS